MAQREKTQYSGVFTYAAMDGRKTYYIRYKHKGRLIEEKAGRAIEGMTAARAFQLRAAKIAGKKQSNQEARGELDPSVKSRSADRFFQALMPAFKRPRAESRDRSEAPWAKLDAHGAAMDGIRDILLFSTADWDNPFWTNKQHMAALFAKRGYRVLYVDSLGLRCPTFHSRDMKRIARRLFAFPIVRQARPNLWRISPLALPFHRSPAVRALNARLVRASVKWHLGLLGMERPLVWTYNPLVAEICDGIPHSGIVYHCVDDLGAVPHIDRKTIAAGEKALGTVAELCFTTSPLLRDRMRKLFPRVVYEPNVSDQPFFETARSGPAEPPELAALPRPRLLFVGALSEYKVDFSLMEALARRCPDVQWVLIGPEGEGQPSSRRPPSLPNVHIFGARAYGRLPYFMAHCDAAVLPVPRNRYTSAMFPMKFFEFLSAGLPLISTRLPALAEFEHLYFPADDEEGFLAGIRQALAGECRDREAIDRACRYHSWEARFARMESVVDAVFPLPGGLEENAWNTLCRNM
jgi:glycosyltransferase involved in cell wall biosynthesis